MKLNDTCRYCGQGLMRMRASKYGSFLGCSRYPDCAGIQKIKMVDPLEAEADRILKGGGQL